MEKTENELKLEQIMKAINTKYTHSLGQDNSRVDVFYGRNKEGKSCLECIVRAPGGSYGGLHFDLQDNGAPLQCRDGDEVLKLSPEKLETLHGLAKKAYNDQQMRICRRAREEMGLPRQ